MESSSATGAVVSSTYIGSSVSITNLKPQISWLFLSGAEGIFNPETFGLISFLAWVLTVCLKWQTI